MIGKRSATELQATVRVQFHHEEDFHDVRVTQNKKSRKYTMQKCGKKNILFFQQLELLLNEPVTGVTLKLEDGMWSHSKGGKEGITLEDHATLTFVNEPSLPSHLLEAEPLYVNDGPWPIEWAGDDNFKWKTMPGRNKALWESRPTTTDAEGFYLDWLWFEVAEKKKEVVEEAPVVTAREESAEASI